MIGAKLIFVSFLTWHLMDIDLERTAATCEELQWDLLIQNEKIKEYVYRIKR